MCLLVSVVIVEKGEMRHNPYSTACLQAVTALRGFDGRWLQRCSIWAKS
jgi:hypothetical protein